MWAMKAVRLQNYSFFSSQVMKEKLVKLHKYNNNICLGSLAENYIHDLKVWFILLDFYNKLMHIDEGILLCTLTEFGHCHDFVKSMVVLHKLRQSLLQNIGPILKVWKRAQNLLVQFIQS